MEPLLRKRWQLYRPEVAVVLLGLAGVLVAPLAAAPAVLLAFTLLLGRLPHAALAVLALALVAGLAGLTVASSDRPQHAHSPAATQAP